MPRFSRLVLALIVVPASSGPASWPASPGPRPPMRNAPRSSPTAPDTGSVRLGSGEIGTLTLALKMGGCEALSARAGAFVTQVAVRTEQAGVFEDDVVVTLPEEVHTGSPREAFCPNSTATSRPPG